MTATQTASDLRRVGVYAPDGTTGIRLDDAGIRVAYPGGVITYVYRDAITGRWTSIPDNDDDDDAEDPRIAYAECPPADDLDAPSGWDPV